ncbi:MAG: translation initiation factor IF-2 [bacterium TMED198]|nr:MAG: translation initiation factor IF-2 [bacterium TMED198]
MKKRIFHIAKELNISHTEIINFLTKKGLEISSHMMPVDEKTYSMILEEFSKDRLEIERFRKDKARKRVVEQNISLESKQELQVEPKKNMASKETADQEKPKKILSTPESSIKLKIIKRSDESSSKEEPSSLKRGSLTDRLKNLKKVDITSISDKINKSKRPTDNKKGSSNLQLNKIISGSSKKSSKKKNKKAVDLEVNDLNSNRKLLKLPEFITVDELAQSLSVSVQDIIKSCINLGLMVTINQRLDMDTIIMVSDEYGCDIETLEDAVEDNVAEELNENKGTDSRAPVVTIMGHVDHGKTSLLDYIRDTNVVAGESGSITQHIGAYEVVLENNKKITFLDTPGHSAFTAMRARGAQVTDIVVIVVAADDKVMPQTIEAIDHAKAASVPIVVAINKIDLPTANSDNIKKGLSGQSLLVEDWGGKIQCAEISSKTGAGIPDLLDKILLEAEVLELKAENAASARGVVVESKLDKGLGPIATVLIQNGTLQKGDIFICGYQFSKVRELLDERSNKILNAEPSDPVQVLGFKEVPNAGEKFIVLNDEKEARKITNQRAAVKRESELRRHKKLTLDQIGKEISSGKVKELSIIIKGDVDGSIEALSDSLMELSTKEVVIKVIHRSVGMVKENDIALATASNAIIIAFNVKISPEAKHEAKKLGVDIRLYSIIYEAINEVKLALEGLLEPEKVEESLGMAEVRAQFKVPKIGLIAGCSVVKGKVIRNALLRVVRNDEILHEGKLTSLKRFKEDVNEVLEGFECGIGVEGFTEFQDGDLIKVHEIKEIKRTL